MGIATSQQDIIRGFLSTILFAPMLLLEKVLLLVKVRFQFNSAIPQFVVMFLIGEIFFSGIVYGYIILYTYKFLRKK